MPINLSNMDFEQMCLLSPLRSTLPCNPTVLLPMDSERNGGLKEKRGEIGEEPPSRLVSDSFCDQEISLLMMPSIAILQSCTESLLKRF